MLIFMQTLLDRVSAPLVEGCNREFFGHETCLESINLC